MKSIREINIIIIAILFLAIPAAAENYPMLELKWTYPVQSFDVYAFDFDRDGKIEIYSSKYETVRSYLYALDIEGNFLYKTWVEKIAQQKLLGCGAPERHAREKIMYFMPVNLDGDRQLDIIAGSSMKGTALVEERVYLFEMLPSGDKTEYQWDYIMGDIPSKVIQIGDDVAVSSLDSSVYLFGAYGELVGKYTFEGAVWDMDLKGGTLEGGVYATFNGIYTLEGGQPKQLLPTNTRVFKVDKGDANRDYIDEIAALTEDGRLLMLDMNNNIILEEKISGLVDVEIIEFQSKNFARTIIAADRIIYSIDENGILRIEKLLNDHINSIHAVTGGRGTEYLIVGTSNDVYLFKINPDFSTYLDGLHYQRNARTYYLAENNCEKAVEYAEKCRELFLDIGYAEGALKCYIIITQCGGIVTNEDKSKEADRYYNNATIMLSERKYESALSYAEISIDIFFDAKDDKGILKADALIQKIRKTWGKEASSLVSSAQDSLDNKDYAQAVTYAEEARQIYRKLNNTQGEINTANLISKANTATSADENLAIAEHYFENKSYSQAAAHAENARKDYLILGYTVEINRADYILNKSLKYAEAGEYYTAAQGYYDPENLMHASTEDLENASYLFGLSREIYEELEDADKVKECDEILTKIRRERNRRIGEEAMNRYWMDFYTYGIGGGILIVLFYIYLVTRRKRPEPKSAAPDNKIKEQSTPPERPVKE